MLEENFITSMIKSDGSWLPFVERPIAAGLAIFTLLVWIGSGAMAWRRQRRRLQPASAA
jgi:TctA family transporter